MDGDSSNPATCRCTYVDRRQVKCATTWCDEHSRIVLGLPYCRRHATVAPSLSNGFFTHMLPDVENRAPSLATWVGAELDTAVRIALTADAPHKDAYVVSGAVRPVRVPGSTMPVWLRSWTLVDSTGVLQHVSIEVDEEDDRAVVVRVGGEPMGRHQPPWIGRPRDETIAPELDAAARIIALVDEAVDAGATILTGGKRDGQTVEPTVLSDVPHDAKVWCEEVFGPVLMVEKAADDAAAFARVNDSPYGLQAGVFTHRLQTAFAAHRELEVGGVIIGDVPSYRADQMPYGGAKQSGVGREGVRYAMQDFTYERVLVLTGIDL